MLSALLIITAAFGLGLALAILPGVGPQTARWLRALAAWAAILAVLAQLLPEAVSAGGPMVLLPFLLGLTVPSAIERAFASERSTEAIAFDVGYLGLLIHAFGDGLAFFALSVDGALWPMIALALHVVPSTTVVALHGLRDEHAAQSRRSLKQPIALGSGLFFATLLGFALGELVPLAAIEPVLPWVIAGAGGVLLHVVFHAWHVHSAEKTA